MLCILNHSIYVTNGKLTRTIDKVKSLCYINLSFEELSQLNLDEIVRLGHRVCFLNAV